MTVNRFENLEIWKNARELYKKIREAINQTALSKDFSLKEQIFRSRKYIMYNIAEEFELDDNKEIQ